MTVCGERRAGETALERPWVHVEGIKIDPDSLYEFSICLFGQSLQIARKRFNEHADLVSVGNSWSEIVDRYVDLVKIDRRDLEEAPVEK